MTDAAESRKSVTVALDNPLVRGDVSIDRVTLRKPMGGDLRGTQLALILNMDVVAVSKVVPRVSEPVITAAEYLAMDGEDCTSIAGEIAAFLLTRQQKTGAGLEP